MADIDKAGDALDNAADKAKDAAGKAADKAVDAAATKAKEVADKAPDAVKDQAKEAVNTAADKAKDAAGKAADKAVDAAKDKVEAAAKGAPEDKKAAKAAKKAAAKADPNHKKKVGITWAIVLVVVAALGIGFKIWHDQPSFCSAICHTPMDYYVDNYYNKDGNTTTLEAYQHMQANVTCLECHEAKIADQVHEGIAWVSGNYTVIESTGAVAEKADFANAAFCLKSGCHGQITTTDQLKEVTSSMSWNPHDFSYHGENADQTKCGNCHVIHGTSVMYCAKCHSQAKSDLPEGWSLPE